ncbi:MAG TPA: nuclear transport factor 2 family protein, partial [Longimicrobium sp.]
MTRRWIFVLGLAILAMLQGTHAAACGQTAGAADSAAIRQAALDYIEGWYAGDAERMARAVHPELAKRIVRTDPQNGQSRLGQQSAMTLVEGTRRGGGRETPAGRQQKDVTILDIYQNAASVRIVASDWIDYLHLAKWNGRWVIVNVLWELKPQPPTASAAPPGGGPAAGQVVLRGGHAAQVEGVAFSPDGRWLASADNGGRVVLWSTNGWRQAAVLRGRNFTEVAFTHDSRRLAAAGFDSLVRVWSVPTGRLLHSLPYPGRAEALAVSPDGRWLAAAGGGERSVRVWEMASGREIRVLRGHTDDVYTLRYSPDGRVLASAGRDRTVRLWDAVSGAPLRTIGGSGDSVYGLAWSVDGAWLAGAGRDG